MCNCYHHAQMLLPCNCFPHICYLCAIAISAIATCSNCYPHNCYLHYCYLCNCHPYNCYYVVQFLPAQLLLASNCYPCAPSTSLSNSLHLSAILVPVCTSMHIFIPLCTFCTSLTLNAPVCISMHNSAIFCTYWHFSVIFCNCMHLSPSFYTSCTFLPFYGPLSIPLHLHTPHMQVLDCCLLLISLCPIN